ncbi:MAG: dephospho-CoA kinase [Lentisphaerae bacterium]|nr:dephospho-CoA kinase [Lentisphaerota bacterium]
MSIAGCVESISKTMIVVGVTGGMAAGKSTVLGCFQALGATVADADAVVHDLYASDRAVAQAVAERWGAGVLTADGGIDRGALAQRVFADDLALQWLNDLIHPRARRRLMDLAAGAATPVFCCAVPLLFEVGWDAGLDHTVAVWCDPTTQWERLRRRGWSDEHIAARLRHQMSMDEKLARAEYGLINTGSVERLRQQCCLLYERFTS